MRRNLSPPLAKVEPDSCLGVDGIPLVRVHSHAEQARIGLVNKVGVNKEVSKYLEIT